MTEVKQADYMRPAAEPTQVDDSANFSPNCANTADIIY